MASKPYLGYRLPLHSTHLPLLNDPLEDLQLQCRMHMGHDEQPRLWIPPSLLPLSPSLLPLSPSPPQ